MPRLHHPDVVKLRNRYHALRGHEIWPKVKALARAGKAHDAETLIKDTIKASPKLQAHHEGSKTSRQHRAAYLRLQAADEKQVRSALRDLSDKVAGIITRAKGTDGKISPGRLSSTLTALQIVNRDTYKQINSSFRQMLRVAAKRGLQAGLAIGQAVIGHAKARKAKECAAIEGDAPQAQFIRVLFVRHAETRLNAEHRIRAGTDEPLSNEGRRQAFQRAQKLSGTPVTKLYAAALARCLDTAQMISAAVGVDVIKDPGFNSIDYGAWAGQSKDKVDKDMEALTARWVHGDPHATPTNGESGHHFQERVLGALKTALETATPGDTIMLVSNGSVAQVYLQYAKNGNQPFAGKDYDAINHKDTDTGDVLEFGYDTTTKKFWRSPEVAEAPSHEGAALIPITLREDDEEDDSPDPMRQTIDYNVDDSIFQKIFKGSLKQTMQAGLFGDTGISNRVWDLRDQNFLVIKRIVSNGIAGGKSAQDIAGDLTDLLSSPDGTDEAVGQGIYRSAYKNAMRLIRTETNRAYGSAGALFAAQKDWNVIWHVSDGQREEDECDELDGEEMSADEFMDQFPQHPNCLCYFTYAIDVPDDTGDDEEEDA